MSDRFGGPAEAALRAAGWSPGRDVSGPTAEAVRAVGTRRGRDGERHRAFPAVLAALDEFGGLTIPADGPGIDHRPRPFAIDPTLAAASTETLADLARVLGVPLYPLGVEGDMEALLAMDERGRVFSIDHTGEWFLGDSMEAAVETLVLGRRPARLRDDGGWD